MIYFCQGCSAVLDHRVNHCQHCGSKQFYDYECSNCGIEVSEFDEDCPECGFSLYNEEQKERFCPWCGESLDIDGRDLNKKYCNNCGHEIGGLIRYSEETGKPLSPDEILTMNDYNKEITDWLCSVLYGGNTFDRMLYIYDKSGSYTGQKFLDIYKDTLQRVDLHYIKNFSSLSDPANLNIVSNEKGRFSGRDIPLICLIDIGSYNERAVSHEIIEYLKDSFYPDIEKYDCYDIVKKIDASFIFVSDCLPEEAKIGSIYDKHFLTISPVAMETVDFASIYNELNAKEGK